MPRPLRSAKLETRSARQKLPVSGKPIYKQIGRGLHLGYRKNKSGGRWVMRQAAGAGQYAVAVIGAADDVLPSDGHFVLDFFQACQVVQQRAKIQHNATRRDHNTYTVRMCFEDYFQAMGPRLKTLKETRSRAGALILPQLGEKLVANLNAEEIRAWHNVVATSAPLRRSSAGGPQRTGIYDSSDLEAVRRRKSSANRLLAILKASLNHAFYERYVYDDQEWRRVKPFPNADAARIRWLTLEEISSVLAVLDAPFGRLFRAALQTGARYGDLCRLRVADFDSTSQCIFIGRPKSDKARQVYLTQPGVSFFESVCRSRPAQERMFLRHDGEPWGPSHQIRRMEAASEMAKLDEPVSFHELRHTYASHAAMNGMTLLVLAHNLGHIDTRMVERHYGHLSDAHKRDMVRRTGLTLEEQLTTR
jgi:integrase